MTPYIMTLQVTTYIVTTWHGLNLAYVLCGMSEHTLGVIYSCHMAWPKPCLVAIWHVIA